MRVGRELRGGWDLDWDWDWVCHWDRNREWGETSPWRLWQLQLATLPSKLRLGPSGWGGSGIGRVVPLPWGTVVGKRGREENGMIAEQHSFTKDTLSGLRFSNSYHLSVLPKYCEYWTALVSRGTGRLGER